MLARRTIDPTLHDRIVLLAKLRNAASSTHRSIVRYRPQYRYPAAVRSQDTRENCEIAMPSSLPAPYAASKADTSSAISNCQTTTNTPSASGSMVAHALRLSCAAATSPPGLHSDLPRGLHFLHGGNQRALPGSTPINTSHPRLQQGRGKHEVIRIAGRSRA